MRLEAVDCPGALYSRMSLMMGPAEMLAHSVAVSAVSEDISRHRCAAHMTVLWIATAFCTPQLLTVVTGSLENLNSLVERGLDVGGVVWRSDRWEDGDVDTLESVLCLLTLDSQTCRACRS